MPITDGQKNLITSSIDYLLDFPETEEGLRQQLELLKEALTKEVDEEHEFFALRKFLIKPTETLKGIEKFNNEVTVAEVQLALLDVCLEAIAKASQGCPHLYEGFKNWLEVVKPSIIPLRDYDRVFLITQTAETNPNFPWENIHDKGTVFSCSLYLCEEPMRVDIVVEVNLPDQTTFHLKFAFVAPDPHYLASNVITNYFYSLIPHAKKFASLYAKEKILDYLLKNLYVNTDEYQRCLNNQNNTDILCHDFYIYLLCNDLINVDFINSLSKEEVDILCNETIVDLIDCEILDVDDAIVFEPHHLQLLTTYYKQVREGSISIEEIFLTDEAHTHLLLLPTIVNPIIKHEITFSDALLLPVYAKALLTNSIYMEYFSHHGAHAKFLTQLSETQCQFMNHKNVAILLANDIISFNDILHLEPELHATILRPKINHLLLNKNLTLEALKDLSISAIKLIDDHPYLAQWIAARIIEPENIQPKKITQLYEKVYSTRLMGLLKREPYVFYHIPDKINELRKEIKAAAFHAQIEDFILQDNIIKAFMTRVIKDIESEIQRGVSSEEKKYFKKLLGLCAAYKSTWTEVLIHCINKANAILNKLDHDHALFKSKIMDIGALKLFKSSPVNIKETSLYKLCEGFLGLAEFIEFRPEVKENSEPSVRRMTLNA